MFKINLINKKNMFGKLRKWMVIEKRDIMENYYDKELFALYARLILKKKSKRIYIYIYVYAD